MENKEYTEDQIIKHEKDCEHFGLKSALRLINDKEIDIEQNQIKVNLPDTLLKFQTGNGEGIWCVPLTNEDLNIYNSEKPGAEFKVVLLNHAISYPFSWGSIIEVKNTHPKNRPVLSKEWINSIIESSTNGEKNLEKFLNNN